VSLVGLAVRANAAEDNREADHAALRALRAKAVEAIDNQDSHALAACCTKEFAFTAIDQTLITSEAQFNALFDRMFRGKDAPIASLKTEPEADILTRFIDANTGICYGSTKDTYTMKDGRVVVMNARWTATVTKENGEWKVAAAHVGTDFLNNPVLTLAVSFWKKLALGAGIISLVVGILLGRVLFARKPTPAVS
jgi:ketosteroid isomerase-like protein